MFDRDINEASTGFNKNFCQVRHLTHRASLEWDILITAVSMVYGVAQKMIIICRCNLSNNKIIYIYWYIYIYAYYFIIIIIYIYICQRDCAENILLKLVCRQFQEILFPLADLGGLQGASAPTIWRKLLII